MPGSPEIKHAFQVTLYKIINCTNLNDCGQITWLAMPQFPQLWRGGYGEDQIHHACYLLKKKKSWRSIYISYLDFLCDLWSLLPVPVNLHPHTIQEVPCPVLPPNSKLCSLICSYLVLCLYWISLTRAILFPPCIVQCHLFRSPSPDSPHSLPPVFPV